MKDKVINLLKENDKAYTISELEEILGINTTDEIERMITALNELESDLLIYHTNKNKYMALEYSHLKKGEISVSDKGFGFVIMENEDDIHIDKDNLNGANDGDIVVIEIIACPKDAKKEGRVLKIKSKDYGLIIGEYYIEKGFGKIKCHDSKIKKTINLTKKNIENLVDGSIVILSVKNQIDRNNLLCEIERVIGHKNDVGIDVESLVYKHMFSPKFSEEVLEEVNKIPSYVSDNEMIGRKDLTNEVIFTIDGDDTKDIDDAISIKKLNNGNYLLGVHIADVSYYVKPGTKLYDDAYERGTSVYLVDRVIPMLPHKLSNGICSLNPNVNRLTISCEMEINDEGKVVNHEIFESVIKSKIQMTYKKANMWLEEGKIAEGYEEYTTYLTLMKELSGILRKSREKRGAIDFETNEAKILVNEQGKPVDIVLRQRATGEMMIEDFMIVANETVASHIYWMELPFVYRVHGIPKEEKVNSFLDFVSGLGYKITGKLNINHPSSIQNILNQLKDKKEYKILSSLMLRAMQKAVYQTENIGHYGISSKIYTHFTSPIRRFPDTTVHRLLRTYLFNNNQDDKTINYFKEYLIELSEHSSMKEREAVDLEREVENMKMAEYMMDHIGEEFSGIISGVTSFGMFVQLPNMIEGLVHISEIKNDYYNYDEKTMSLVGQRKKKRYKIGDDITVKVVSASKEESFIDFEIVEQNYKEVNLNVENI